MVQTRICSLVIFFFLVLFRERRYNLKRKRIGRKDLRYMCFARFLSVISLKNEPLITGRCVHGPTSFNLPHRLKR